MLGKIGRSGTESKQQSKKGGYLLANSLVYLVTTCGDGKVLIAPGRTYLYVFVKPLVKSAHAKVTIFSSSMSDQ